MKKQIGKLFIEGLLIVFSVLFALYINRKSEQSKINTKKELAMDRMEKELIKNKAIINDWYEKHSKIRDRLTGIIQDENDSLRLELLKYDYLNFGVLTNEESLIEVVLTDIAWEAAKTTEVISELDYELVEKLTYVYTMQDHLIDNTLQRILELYFDTNAHDMKNFDPTMLQYQLRFWELTGQEVLMQQLIDNAIEEISSKQKQ